VHPSRTKGTVDEFTCRMPFESPSPARQKTIKEQSGGLDPAMSATTQSGPRGRASCVGKSSDKMFWVFRVDHLELGQLAHTRDNQCGRRPLSADGRDRR
jgi:hypothetical protein